MNMSDVVKTIVSQLRPAMIVASAFTFLEVNDNTLKVMAGTRGIVIEYDRSEDLYNVKTFKGADITGDFKGMDTVQMVETAREALGM